MMKQINRASEVFERIIVVALLVMLAVMVLLGTVSLAILMYKNGIARFHGVNDAAGANNEHACGDSEFYRSDQGQQAAAERKRFEGFRFNYSSKQMSGTLAPHFLRMHPESTYQQALSAVNRHLTRNKPQFRQPDASTAPASYPVTKE